MSNIRNTPKDKKPLEMIERQVIAQERSADALEAMQQTINGVHQVLKSLAMARAAVFQQAAQKVVDRSSTSAMPLAVAVERAGLKLPIVKAAPKAIKVIKLVPPGAIVSFGKTRPKMVPTKKVGARKK